MKADISAEERAAIEYLASGESIPWTSREAEADAVLHRIAKLRPLPAAAKVFEIGTGGGWFLVRCADRGLDCSGVEYNRWFRDHAVQLGRHHGHDLDVVGGSIETAELPDTAFDVVVAMSVLEHVPDYRAALRRAHSALRPGGVLYLTTTNKFSPRSGEYTGLPLYGWFPRPIRYRIRARDRGSQGGDVTIDPQYFDWNQFTYPGLRRELRHVGFSKVVDLLELLEPDDLTNPSAKRKAVLRMCRSSPLLKWILTPFLPNTVLFAVK